MEQVVNLVCNKCGGTMDAKFLPNGSCELVCPYCGSKDVVLTGDDVEKERIKSVIEKNRQEYDLKKMQIENDSKKNEDRSELITGFLYSVVIIVLLGMAFMYFR